jgi:hypothetical protein
MTLPAFFALQNSDLSAFLYADVGDERNGMTLTMVSTIARIGRDPWEEAARLAALPKASATSQLAQIIHDVPTTNCSLAEASSVASRLVQLLPTNSGTVVSGSTFSLRRLIFGPVGAAALIYAALAAIFIVNLLLQDGWVMDRPIDNPIMTNESRNHGTSTAVTSADIADVARTHPSMPELTGDWHDLPSFENSEIELGLLPLLAMKPSRRLATISVNHDIISSDRVT